MDSAPQVSGIDQFTQPPYLNRAAGATTVIGFDSAILVPVPAGSAYRVCSVDAAIYVSVAVGGSEIKLDVVPDGCATDSARTFTMSSASTGYVGGTRLTNFDLVPGEINRIGVRLYSESNAAVTGYLQVLAFSQTS